jgi:hypothetical protein
MQHNVGPRPRRLNVPELGAMMLTLQPVRNLACVSEVPVVVEI